MESTQSINEPEYNIDISLSSQPTADNEENFKQDYDELKSKTILAANKNVQEDSVN